MTTNLSERILRESPYLNKGFFNFASTAQLPRHRWYYFKEGFSASLIKEAIHRYSNGTNKVLSILDPFSGSGTTALTAALNGHKCTGIEVNPFLAFVTKVKSLPRKWRRKDFMYRLNKILQLADAETINPLEDYSTFCEREGLDRWLFNKGVLRKYSALDESITVNGGSYSEPLKLALLVAAYDCCNAKRDGKALRYKNGWQELSFSGEHLVAAFKEYASIMIDDVELFPIETSFSPTVLTGDARRITTSLPLDSYDLVVTSPPYLNSFDYSDVYRPELFLGKYVSNNEQLAIIRKNTIRSHVQVNWSKDILFKSSMLDPIVDQVSKSENLWNTRIPLMIEAYFDDIYCVLLNLRNKLKAGGQIWLVVSTSAYVGVHIPVDFIIAESACDAGYMLEEIHILRDLRASGQQWKNFSNKTPPLRESLVILRKSA